jgi:hypothetical protein
MQNSYNSCAAAAGQPSRLGSTWPTSVASLFGGGGKEFLEHLCMCSGFDFVSKTEFVELYLFG